jgi:hypothetical protein
MNEADLSNLLDKCVQQMRAGSSLNEVLEKYPAQSAELRPVLETAWIAYLHKECEPIPSTTQNKSRASFLTRAVELRQDEKPKFKGWSFFSHAYRTAVISIVIISAMLFTGLASANTLPGDLLYPVKINVERAEQALITDSPSRVRGEVNFDSRRTNEVKRLLASGRSESVFFGGFLTRDESQLIPTWLVENITLTFDPSFTQNLDALAGSFVEINGITQLQGMVKVENLSLRLFQLDGKIEEVSENFWLVDGMKIGISPQTHIGGIPVPGKQAAITAILFPESQWVALTAQVNGSSQTDLNLPQLQTPEPTEKPELIETADSKDEEEKQSNEINDIEAAEQDTDSEIEPGDKSEDALDESEEIADQKEDSADDQEDALEDKSEQIEKGD